MRRAAALALELLAAAALILISCAANLPVQGEVKSAAGRRLDAAVPALSQPCRR